MLPITVQNLWSSHLLSKSVKIRKNRKTNYFYLLFCIGVKLGLVFDPERVEVTRKLEKTS
jgi:hypothetical protein